jgi:hypothetical protein
MWQQHGPLDDRDEVSGIQAGRAYGLRFTNPDHPGALIEVHHYAAYSESAYNVSADQGPYYVRRSTTYLLCGDVERPGDTETWSDSYEPAPDGPYATVAATETAARVRTEQFQANSLTWDGQQFSGWAQAPGPK